MEREQGLDRSGNARVRRILVQLAWRWLRFQPENALSRWFAERTSGAKGRIRTIMIVALARKLLVALWRYVETGVVPADVRLAAGCEEASADRHTANDLGQGNGGSGRAPGRERVGQYVYIQVEAGSLKKK